MLEDIHQCQVQCFYSLAEGHPLPPPSKTGEAARSAGTHPRCLQATVTLHVLFPVLFPGRKAKPGHKDPHGQSGGFFRPQERSSLITFQQVNNLLKATWGLSGRTQSRKVSPKRSGFQQSGLETKKRIMVLGLLWGEKLGFSNLTQACLSSQTTQGSCGMLKKDELE